MGDLCGGGHAEGAHPPALAPPGPHVGAPHDGRHADQGLNGARRTVQGLQCPHAPVEQGVDEIRGAVTAQHLRVDESRCEQAPADQHGHQAATAQPVQPGAEPEDDQEAERQRRPERRVGEPGEVERRLEADHRGRADKADDHRHQYLAHGLHHGCGRRGDHHREDGRHHAGQHGGSGAQHGLARDDHRRA
jgi:hypothetical protein